MLRTICTLQERPKLQGGEEVSLVSAVKTAGRVAVKRAARETRPLIRARDLRAKASNLVQSRSSSPAPACIFFRPEPVVFEVDGVLEYFSRVMVCSRVVDWPLKCRQGFRRS